MAKHATAKSRTLSIIGTICHVVSTIAMLLLTAFAVSWVTLGQEWDAIIKSPDYPVKEWSAQHWESTVESIRLHESQTYIESIMGLPQINQVKKTGEIGRGEKQVIEYEEAVYINRFFSLYCVYVDDSLTGFLVISSDEAFTPTNYRTGITCFEDSISNSALKCDTQKMADMCIAANCSPRSDNSSYYIECKMQHSYDAGEIIYVGYGLSDLGYMPSDKRIDELLNENESIYNELKSSTILANNAEAAKIAGGNINGEVVQTIIHADSLAMRSQRVNAFFVFDDYQGAGIELLRDSIMTKPYLGMNRDRYYGIVAKVN